ncbi:MAG TPA: hypothetical protein VJ572_12195 [Azonexus sp.]|nr:hypothetical protein [Azonexus sp.]
MNQPLPVGDRIIQLIEAIAEHRFPLPTGFDNAATQIPVHQGIARQHALPVAQADISAISRIDLTQQLLQPLDQCGLLGGASRLEQLPELRLALATENLLKLTGQQPGFHGL